MDGTNWPTDKENKGVNSEKFKEENVLEEIISICKELSRFVNKEKWPPKNGTPSVFKKTIKDFLIKFKLFSKLFHFIILKYYSISNCRM